MESLKNRIKNYFQNNPEKWINGGTIERLSMDIGKKASNASRRLRELENEGFLERQIIGNSVSYKLAVKGNEC